MYRVMIVDDQEIMRRLIRRIPLWGDSSGFQIVSEASDGKEALDQLSHQSVDLLITDIRMPRMDGLELLREVRTRRLVCLVVFLTEFQEFSYARQAIDLGAFGYLVKPVGKEDLANMLDKARRQLEEQLETDSRVHHLEEELLDKTAFMYPQSQVLQVAEMLLYNPDRVGIVIQKLVDEVCAITDGDLVKAEIILQKACQEIWKEITSHFRWLPLFASIPPYVHWDLSSSDLTSMKNDLEENLEAVRSTIAYFLFPESRHPAIGRVCQYVLEHVEEDPSVGRIAKDLYLSKNYLGDLFRHETGMTLIDYIVQVKMERAKILLRTTSLYTYEIAQLLGYSSAEYFAKSFRKATSMTATAYRQSFRDTE